MCDALHPLIDLPQGDTLRIADGNAHIVAVFEGQVWLTMDGDARDIVLSAGESFAFDGPGLVLVYAFRDARVMLLEPEAPVAIATPINAFELQRWARAQRDAAVAAALARAWRAFEAGAAGLARRVAAAWLPRAAASLPRPIVMSSRA